MPDIPFAQQMRLIWIDATLAAHGRLNRADICAAFAISIPQASTDLRLFQATHPGRIIYDHRQKAYFRASTRPVYPTEARYEVHRAASIVLQVGRERTCAS